MSKRNVKKIVRPGYRPGAPDETLAEVEASISKEELQRIKDQRQFENVERGTFEYDLAVHLDSLRRIVRKLKADITKHLWNIRQDFSERARAQEQIDSGKIYDEVKDGVTMTKFELKSKIFHCKLVGLAEVRRIADLLAQLRANVGFKGNDLKIVMTREEYIKYINDVRAQLKGLGRDIFD